MECFRNTFSKVLVWCRMEFLLLIQSNFSKRFEEHNITAEVHYVFVMECTLLTKTSRAKKPNI